MNSACSRDTRGSVRTRSRSVRRPTVNGKWSSTILRRSVPSTTTSTIGSLPVERSSLRIHIPVAPMLGFSSWSSQTELYEIGSKEYIPNANQSSSIVRNSYATPRWALRTLHCLSLSHCPLHPGLCRRRRNSCGSDYPIRLDHRLFSPTRRRRNQTRRSLQGLHLYRAHPRLPPLLHLQAPPRRHKE